MGDSDDDYERRRRDKFRGERSEYGSSGGGGGGNRREDTRRREDWNERFPNRGGRDSWNNRERGGSRRDYGGGGREYGRARERYSPIRHDMSPPMKRMRPDWEERRYPYDANYGSYGTYGHDYPHAPMHTGAPGGAAGSRLDELGPTQPPMMSFKAFMEQCEDNIMEEEALRKYSEYKLEFKRQQLNDFFINHKEEEWFKAKYHPEECVKRKDEQIANLKRRVSVFEELYDAQRLEAITVDADQSDQLLKLLDSVVIKLEGGTDLDLQILDLPPEEEVKPTPGSADTDDDKKPFVLGEDSSDGEEGKKTGEDGDNPKDVNDEQKALQLKAKEYLKQPSNLDEKVKKERGRKRKHSGSSSSSSSDSSDSSSSDSEDEPAAPGTEEVPPPGMEPPAASPTLLNKEEDEKMETTDKKEDEGEKKEEGSEDVSEDKKEEEDISPKSPITSQEEEEDQEDEEGKKKGDEEKTTTEEAKKDGEDEVMKNGDDQEVNNNKESSDKEEKEEEPQPRALHKTASIFLRNLAPTITKQEVEAMCRRYKGFLRAAIAEPQPERRWFRRGWVTFKRSVNIKDICWNLNNIRLRDCELGAIVNRDLSRRIRTVNGITSHRGVVRADIKLAAKIIQNLDSRWNLWTDAENGQENPLVSLTSSSNPVLRNITDYLIEEASAEEEELLGGNNDGTSTEDKTDGETIERDPLLIKVLDRLLLYLRIVHSVDYYNHSEYPNEDEMPNRCGIMHARGIPPSSKVTTQEVQDYCRGFENKIGSFLQPLTKLSDDEAKKLGLKECEDEVTKFIQSNTQEVAKDKWQCPLCGKKFKAAEFVHKHILNKHNEKVTEVKKEVDYFNNYLRDPKRPQLPEYLGGKQGVPRKEDGRPDPYVAAYPQQNPMYGYGNYGAYGNRPGYGSYGNNYPKEYYNREMYPRDVYQRPRATYRSRVGYRDLDAPKEDY